MSAILFRPSCVNLSLPSATYMLPWIGSALFQIMACRLFSTKPLSEPVLGLLSIGPLGTNFSEIFYQNTKLFIQENASENIVFEKVAILSRARWVYWWKLSDAYRSVSYTTFDSDNGFLPIALSHHLNQCWLIVNCTFGKIFSVKFASKYTLLALCEGN